MSIHADHPHLTKAEFIRLDPSLSLLHANGLILRSLQPGAWRYRINPGDRMEEPRFATAEAAAYARYVAMNTRGSRHSAGFHL